MKTVTSGLALMGTALLITACDSTDPAHAPSSALTASAAPQQTSSNPLQSLPAMSADRCVAEAIGTATDPKTGAPVSATIDPQTGKPVCPPEQPIATKPKR